MPQKLNDGETIETQEHLTNRFECIAYGLKTADLAALSRVAERAV